MILSHRHKFIFFAVPRTGTHAIRTVLAPWLGEGDWQQEALLGLGRAPMPRLAQIPHGHISLRQVQASLPEAVWRNYFKFAVVRNPYDRFVSACAFLNRDNPAYAGRERAFMRGALQSGRFQRRVLIQPQTALLEDELGALGMDCIGRYETLQESFTAICRQIGLAPQPLALANASTHGDYATYYDDQLLQQVTAFYRQDFENFGYAPMREAQALPCA